MSSSQQPARSSSDPKREQPSRNLVNPAPRSPADPVEEASDESFPASDPPAFTHTTATRDGEAED